MSKIIAICGFSGAGKDAIAKYISKHYGYEMVISTTSRPMREGESEGNPYHFVNKKKFLDLIEFEEFIEYRCYNTLLNGIQDTWYYGIQKNTIKSDVNYVVVLDLCGLAQLKKHFNNVLSFFIDVGDTVRKTRAIHGRKDFDETEWSRRLADDKIKFTKDKINECVDFKVKNYSFKECIKNIMKEVDL